MWAILQFVAVGVVVTTASKICPSGCFCADSTIECYQIDTDFFRDFPTGTGVRWSELQISNSPNLTTLNFTDTSLFHSLKGFKVSLNKTIHFDFSIFIVSLF